MADRRVAPMLGFGFSSGIAFLLVETSLIGISVALLCIHVRRNTPEPATG
ncbi:hypothetical protein [Methylopila sp. M107]|nr:hypothetical protein [Methylopila sp. M107]